MAITVEYASGNDITGLRNDSSEVRALIMAACEETDLPYSVKEGIK